MSMMVTKIIKEENFGAYQWKGPNTQFSSAKSRKLMVPGYGECFYFYAVNSEGQESKLTEGDWLVADCKDPNHHTKQCWNVYSDKQFKEMFKPISSLTEKRYFITPYQLDEMQKTLKEIDPKDIKDTVNRVRRLEELLEGVTRYAGN